MVGDKNSTDSKLTDENFNITYEFISNNNNFLLSPLTVERDALEKLKKVTMSLIVQVTGNKMNDTTLETYVLKLYQAYQCVLYHIILVDRNTQFDSVDKLLNYQLMKLLYCFCVIQIPLQCLTFEKNFYLYNFSYDNILTVFILQLL